MLAVITHWIPRIEKRFSLVRRLEPSFATFLPFFLMSDFIIIIFIIMILFYLVLYSEILLPFPSLLDIAGIAKLMKRLKKKKGSLYVSYNFFILLKFIDFISCFFFVVVEKTVKEFSRYFYFQKYWIIPRASKGCLEIWWNPEESRKSSENKTRESSKGIFKGRALEKHHTIESRRNSPKDIGQEFQKMRKVRESQ